MNRRGFIRLGAASVGTLALRPLGLIPAMASTGTGYRALVCVFLFGGNDSNNSIIPSDDTNFPAYTAARGPIALSGSELTQVTSVSGAPYAFHSGLTELASLFTSKELAVVANVGSLVQPLTRAQYQAAQLAIPSNLFSHSDQQLQWQTSIAQGGATTGWAGRAADYIASQGINSTKFPTFLTVAGNILEGVGSSTQQVALAPGGSLALTGFTSTNASQEILSSLKSLLTFDTGVSLVQAANGILGDSIADAGALTSALSKGTALKTTFPNTSIGQQLKQVAEIIQVQSNLGMQRQIFFCSLGGFDTHTSELSQHNVLYPQLSPALSAFYNATQEIGMADSVTTFTESDFNRTFQSTSGNGSDHAWGGHHFVLGGAVQGGQIYGQFPAFELGGPNDTDTRGRWIPTTAIDQYGATLCSWFGIPDNALATIFPNFANFSSQKLTFFGSGA